MCDLEDALRELREDYAKIRRGLRQGAVHINALHGDLAVEVFKHRGMQTNMSLQYARKAVKVLPVLVEWMIVSSPRIRRYLNHHPLATHANPFSALGDIALFRRHPDYAFKSKLRQLGHTVGKRTQGLFDPATRRIHLKASATVGHAVHEGVHSFSTIGHGPPGFLTMFGSFLYEGVTQVFTDMVLADFRWDKMRGHAYGDQAKCARRFLADFTEPRVAGAYFAKSPGPLAKAVARKMGIPLHELVTLRNGKGRGNRGRGAALCERLGYL